MTQFAQHNMQADNIPYGVVRYFGCARASTSRSIVLADYHCPVNFCVGPGDTVRFRFVRMSGEVLTVNKQVDQQLCVHSLVLVQDVLTGQIELLLAPE